MRAAPAKFMFENDFAAAGDGSPTKLVRPACREAPGSGSRRACTGRTDPSDQMVRGFRMEIAGAPPIQHLVVDRLSDMARDIGPPSRRGMQLRHPHQLSARSPDVAGWCCRLQRPIDALDQPRDGFGTKVPRTGRRPHIPHQMVRRGHRIREVRGHPPRQRRHRHRDPTRMARQDLVDPRIPVSQSEQLEQVGLAVGFPGSRENPRTSLPPLSDEPGVQIGRYASRIAAGNLPAPAEGATCWTAARADEATEGKGKGCDQGSGSTECEPARKLPRAEAP